jgi:1-phosphofructokinase family hexose kinase
MIVAVDLNPSLDRTLTVERLEEAAVNRAHTVRLDPSGKGLNVARALNAWGVPMRALALLGGGAGATLARLLEGEEVPCEGIPIAGETRSNIVIVDEARGTYIKVNEAGPAVSPQELAALEGHIDSRAAPGDLWVFSGRLPPTAPPDTYARLIGLVQSRGARALLDASGQPFVLGAAARPYLIKPNQLEAQELTGRPIRSERDALDAIRTLWARGSEAVAITCGAKGAFIGYRGTIVEAVPPAVAAVSAVGPGDATMAGLAWGLLQGLPAPEMARLAVAAGTATTLVEGTGMATLAEVEAMRPQVQVRVL